MQRNQSRLIKILADSFDYRLTAVLLLSILLFTGTLYYVALFFVPKVFTTLNANASCPPPGQQTYPCNQLHLADTRHWQAIVTNVTAANSFLMLVGFAFPPPSADNRELTTEINFQSEVTLLNEDLSIDDSAEVIRGDSKLLVHCPPNQEACDPNVFIMYPQVTHANYLLRIEIDDSFMYEKMLDEVHFYVYGNKPGFTAFLLVLRYAGLAASVAAFISYWRFFQATPAVLRTFEHKAILCLSIGLMLFNDPLYGITILNANCFMAVVSTLFVTTFISALIFFWLVMVRRIHSEKSHADTKLLSSVAVAFGAMVFVLLSSSGVVASVFSRWNPSEHFYLE